MGLNPYFLLAAAIISEVFGSAMLKVSNGFKRLFPSLGVVLGYGAAFYLLSLALKAIPLGTAYAIWAGVGTALTALIGVLVWHDPFNWMTLVGLVFIIGGIVLLRM